MSIRNEIRLDTRKYLADLKQTERATGRFAKNSEQSIDGSGRKMQNSFQKIGQSAKLWIAGAAAGAVLTLQRVFSSLRKEVLAADSQFTKSFAIQADLTEQQKQRMKRAAKEVSADLNLSLDKVAESYYFLASAGLDVEEQIANLPVVARFAKAGMFDLATATDLLTDAQSALGLTVEDTLQNQQNMIRVSDVLSKANQMANASIQQFSESLTNKAGSALKNYNKDLEEGVAVLAAYADQGVKGNLAGERFNILLKRLAEQAINNKSAFKRMNVEVFDAQGNYRNIADIIEDLENALSGLSAEQRQAALAQLGFTAESQDAILALIGLSDKIREYEDNARSAAGTTEEIAKEQMGSLIERLEALKRQFVLTFGDSFLSLLEKGMERIEDFTEKISGIHSRFAESSSERVLAALRENEAPGALIKLFERRVAMEEARQLKEEIKKELDGLSIPVGIEPKSNSQKIAGFFEQFKNDFWEPGWKNLLETIPNAFNEIQSFDFVEEGFSADKVKEYQEQIDTLTQRINEYSEAVADMDHGEQRDRLSEYIEKMQEWKGDLQDALGLYQTYLASLENEKAAKEKNITVTEEGNDAQGDTNKELKKTIELSDRSVEAVNFFAKEIQSLADTKMDGLVSDFQEFQDELVKLNNEFESGNISQEVYEQRLSKLGDDMRKKLNKVFNEIKNNLTPEQQKLWKSMMDGVGKTNEGLEETDSQLRDIADAASSVLTLAEAFGEVDDNVRNVIRGTIEVLRNIDNLKSAEGLGIIAPALGIGAGVASILSGIIGGSKEEAQKQRERMRELQFSLESLRRAVDRNTRAFYESEIIGGDLSGEDRDTIGSTVSSVDPSNVETEERFRVRGRVFESERDAVNWLKERYGLNEGRAYREVQEGRFDYVPESEKARIREDLQFLGELAPDLFGESLEMFDNLIAQGYSVQEALEMMDLAGAWEDAEERIGESGDSFEAAVREFNRNVNIRGMDINEAFDIFTEKVSGLDDVSDPLKNKLQEIANLDLTTEEGKKAFKEIMQEIYDDPDSFMGDMEPNEFWDYIEWLAGLEDGTISGGPADEGFSRSVQVARTITDVQANEVVMLLEAIEYWTRQTAARLGDETALSLPTESFGFKGLDIPIPLPVEIQNWDEKPTQPVAAENSGPTTFNTSITVNAPSGSDPGGIDYDQVAKKIGYVFSREIRSGKF